MRQLRDMAVIARPSPCFHSGRHLDLPAYSSQIQPRFLSLVGVVVRAADYVVARRLVIMQECLGPWFDPRPNPCVKIDSQTLSRLFMVGNFVPLI